MSEDAVCSSGWYPGQHPTAEPRNLLKAGRKSMFVCELARLMNAGRVLQAHIETYQTGDHTHGYAFTLYLTTQGQH